MEDYFKRIDKTKIAPYFMVLCDKLIAACLARGAAYYAISGYRSPAEQAALHAIGRTTDLHKKPVTNAGPYQSYHNYGLAIDFCRDADATKEGLQPDWNIAHYDILAEEAKKLGLEPGLYWHSFKEGPHVQIASGPMSLHDMEAAIQAHGLQGFWDVFTTHLPTV